MSPLPEKRDRVTEMYGDDDIDEMDQRCAYVDGEILFMKWNSQKDGWVPDMTMIRQHTEGRLRVYQPSDAEEFLVTMPGHILWPLKSDDTDIREVIERPWFPAALLGMREDEIDAWDEYRMSAAASAEEPQSVLRLDIRVNGSPTLIEIPSRYQEDLAATVLASLSSYRPRPTVTVQRPPPLPKHIQTIVLEKAEAEGKTCPITLTPIKRTTGSVTSCGHMFQTAAIQEWMRENATCPECRQICSCS